MKVREILGQSARQEQEQPSPLLCLPRCRIGVEYEWEKTGNWEHETMLLADGRSTPKQDLIKGLDTYFNRHNDGSLREAGREWVFKGPFSGTRIISAIKAMDDAARGFGFAGNYRTSMHVHLDMQDLSFPDDVGRFGCIYSIVEPFLYDFVGNDRHACNYCVPWYAHPQHFEQYMKTVKDPRLAAAAQPALFASHFRNQKQIKYSGLNFFSLGDFGTVEFRQAPVTMQYDKILTWINLIMRQKKWVVDNSNMSGEDIITRAHKMGPELFLKEIFSSDYKDATRNTRDIYSQFKVGLNTLYQFVALS